MPSYNAEQIQSVKIKYFRFTAARILNAMVGVIRRDAELIVVVKRRVVFRQLTLRMAKSVLLIRWANLHMKVMAISHS